MDVDRRRALRSKPLSEIDLVGIAGLGARSEQIPRNKLILAGSLDARIAEALSLGTPLPPALRNDTRDEEGGWELVEPWLSGILRPVPRAASRLALGFASLLIPLWEEVLPGDSPPRSAYLFCEQYCRGTVSASTERAVELADLAWEFLLELDPEGLGETLDTVRAVGSILAHTAVATVETEIEHEFLTNAGLIDGQDVAARIAVMVYEERMRADLGWEAKGEDEDVSSEWIGEVAAQVLIPWALDLEGSP